VMPRRVPARHQRRERWTAYRMGVGVGKTNALPREALHVRRSIVPVEERLFLPEGHRRVLPPHVVHDEQTDVRLHGSLLIAALRLGRREDVIDALEARFGEIPYTLSEAINHVNDDAKLKELLRQAVLVKSLGEFKIRRSCTTELIRGNANLYHVKELLGHASLSTLKPYTKLTITDLKKTHAKCHPRELDASDSDSGEATSDDVDCPPSDTPDDQKTEDTRDRHPKS